MNITYFYSRKYVNMPFIRALRQNNINTEAIHLLNRDFLITQFLQRFIQLSCAPISESLVICDYVGIASGTLNIKKKLKTLKNGYILRLRGDIFIENITFLNPFIDSNIKSSNAIFHLAKYLEQKYKILYPSIKHFTIYNGIDLNPPIKDKHVDINKCLNLRQNFKIFILTVMNFNIRQKIMYFSLLLPIIKRITNEYSALFVFIGGGKYLPEIKSIFHGQKGVLFLGRLPRNIVLKIIPYFDIFFYPSGLDVLPNAVLEASASGLPVISTSVGGIPEIIVDTETGFLMENISEDGYRYLKLLIEDEDLRHKISRCGIEYVTKKFNWNKVTNNFLQIIKSEMY